MRGYIRANGNIPDAAVYRLPDGRGKDVTKKEQFELAVRLAAHERLLKELLILVRVQRDSTKRLSDYRDRIAKELDQDEDHPVEIDAMTQAVHDAVVRIIDGAFGLIAESRKRTREQS